MGVVSIRFIAAALLATDAAAAACYIPGAPPPFHGCPTMADRNRTIAIAQACAARPAPASADASAPHPCSLLSGPAAYCGFASARADAWLARLASASASCTHVLYTVITGHSDMLKPVSRGKARKQPRQGPERAQVGGGTWCAIALIDANARESSVLLSAADLWRASSGTAWLRFALPAGPLFADQNGVRAGHALRAAGMRLFPNAAWTVYMDGKAGLRIPPDTLIARVSELTPLPLIVFEHPHWLSLDTELMQVRKHLRVQNRSGLAADLIDVDRAEALYRSEGMLNHQAGMVDSFVIVQHRTAVRSAWSGIEPAGACAVLRSIECVWFNEIALLSQRVQVSFFYAMDLLGARRHVFVVPRTFYAPGDMHSPVGKWFYKTRHLDVAYPQAPPRLTTGGATGTVGLARGAGFLPQRRRTG
jgi:hypothetical protein